MASGTTSSLASSKLCLTEEVVLDVVDRAGFETKLDKAMSELEGNLKGAYADMRRRQKDNHAALTQQLEQCNVGTESLLRESAELRVMVQKLTNWLAHAGAFPSAPGLEAVQLHPWELSSTFEWQDAGPPNPSTQTTVLSTSVGPPVAASKKLVRLDDLLPGPSPRTAEIQKPVTAPMSSEPCSPMVAYNAPNNELQIPMWFDGGAFAATLPIKTTSKKNGRRRRGQSNKENDEYQANSATSQKPVYEEPILEPNVFRI